MNALLNLFVNPGFWYGVLRSTTPILLAALGSILANRAGIVNLGIEGMMLFGALFAVLVSGATQSATMGLLASVLICVAFSLALGYFKLKMKADEVLVGIAINLLAEGATIFLLFLAAGERATSASVPSKMLPSIQIPFIQNIPFLGRVLSNQNILMYVSILLVFVVQYLLFQMPLGLRIRSVGGNPHSAESVGVSVKKTQYIALALSGVLIGLSGAFMSMGYMSVFTRGMTAGRGFIAMAAANVGGAVPIGALFASLLFGFFDSLGNNLQGLTIPSEIIYMIPYVATIVAYSMVSYNRKKGGKSSKLMNRKKKESIVVQPDNQIDQL